MHEFEISTPDLLRRVAYLAKTFMIYGLVVVAIIFLFYEVEKGILYKSAIAD